MVWCRLQFIGVLGVLWLRNKHCNMEHSELKRDVNPSAANWVFLYDKSLPLIIKTLIKHSPTPVWIIPRQSHQLSSRDIFISPCPFGRLWPNPRPYWPPDRCSCGAVRQRSLTNGFISTVLAACQHTQSQRNEWLASKHPIPVVSTRRCFTEYTKQHTVCKHILWISRM